MVKSILALVPIIHSYKNHFEFTKHPRERNLQQSVLPFFNTLPLRVGTPPKKKTQLLSCPFSLSAWPKDTEKEIKTEMQTIIGKNLRTSSCELPYT